MATVALFALFSPPHIFLLPIKTSVIAMSQAPKHFQGLQIVDGEPPQKLEVRGWLGAFMIREAILICPHNLSSSEEAIYCNTIGHFLVCTSYISSETPIVSDITHQKSVLSTSEKEAAGATYRTPYILLACAALFDQVSRYNRNVTKADLISVLRLCDQELLLRSNTTVTPLHITSKEAAILKASRPSMFWLIRRTWSVFVRLPRAHESQS